MSEHWKFQLSITYAPILVAARSRVRGCGSSLAGIAGSKLDGAWITVSCECCVLSGRGLCDVPITRTEESYREWLVSVWLRGLIRHNGAVETYIYVCVGGGGWVCGVCLCVCGVCMCVYVCVHYVFIFLQPTTAGISFSFASFCVLLFKSCEFIIFCSLF